MKQSDLDEYRFYQCYEKHTNIKCERIYDINYKIKENSKLIFIPINNFHPKFLDKYNIYFSLLPSISSINIVEY